MSAMRKILLAFFTVLSGPLTAIPSFITFPSDVAWRQQASPHFEVIFRQGDEKLAEKVLRIAEHTHKILSPVFPEGPGYTRIVLADFQDSTNGYALNFPYSHIVLFLSPPEPIGQLTSLDDWLSSLILHEYTHILHIYPAAGIWRPMRTIFGTWVVPNGLMPTHFHEGMATFIETEFTKGGRGRSSSFNMGRRMAVAEGKWNLVDQPLDRMEATQSIWPMGVSPYFYGYYFTQELFQRKGLKGIYQLTDSFSSNWPYLLNGPLEEVYGSDYTQMWEEIYKKTGEKTKQEIAAIKKTPLSPLNFLTSTKYHMWDVTLSPDAKRVAFRRTRPQDGNRLIIADAATGKELSDLDIAAGGTFSLCWGTKDGHEVLIYPKVGKEENYSVNNVGGWDITDDKSISVSTLKHVQLFQCDPSLQKIVLYQERATVGSLLELDWSKKEPPKLKRQWALPSGTYVSAILVRDGTWFLLKDGLKTQLYRWDAKDPQPVLEIPAYAYNLRAGRRPGELLAITTLDGRDEIYSLDVHRKEIAKVVGLMSGVSSFDQGNDKFWVSAYRYGGYDLAIATPIAGEKRKVAQLKPAPPRRQIAEEGVKLSAAESYSAASTLLPRTWVPSLLFVPDGVQFGVWIPGFDIAQKHFYDIFGGYDTRGSMFANLGYNYRVAGSHIIGAEAYLSPNYLISATAIQTQWGGAVFYQGDWSFLPPSLRLGFEYKKTEASPLGDKNVAIGPQIGLSYRVGFKQRPLDVSPTRGTSINITHSHYFRGMGSDDTYFSSIIGIDQYLAAPWWKESMFYFNARGGYTEGNSIYNSYFTAGGELLFSQGRNYFQNRGFQPQFLISRRIANFTAEYRFPIAGIERGYNLWPAFLKRVHGALVMDVTTRDLGLKHPRDTYTSNLHNLFRIFYTSAGLEIKSDWTFGFYLPSQIRIGVYHGFGDFGESIYGTLGFEAAI